MKAGLTFSSVAHVALLSLGLFSVSGPKPFEVQEVETLSADFVPFEAISQSLQGVEEGPIAETPAPEPTKRPEIVPEAENIGETDRDVVAPKEAEREAPPVEAAKAPPPAPEPTPVPEVKPDPAEKPVEESKPAPTTEVAAVSEPSVPVTADPVADQIEQAEAGEQFAALPQSVPVPVSRPKAPQPQSAQTPERKKTEEAPAKKANESSSTSKSTTDEISALLNKEEPTAGGAKRSTEQASVGARKKSQGATKLSRSEMDALRSAIENNWSIPVGLESADKLRATVKMRLKPDGSVDGKPDVSASGGSAAENRRFAESVRRAVLRSAPYSLPKEKYETWEEVIVNFDASQMF